MKRYKIRKGSLMDKAKTIAQALVLVLILVMMGVEI